ncbi:MAG: phosphoglycerate mutase family protein [Sphingomonas bacterium]|nr:phosphoglycerate mutase family protein [Sphingomonas bacterium]
MTQPFAPPPPALRNPRKGRDFIARHGETVFNAARRLQGDYPHTPLTRAGFTQADEMGAALVDILGPAPDLLLWSSSAGRALQTLAVITERLDLDWHQAKTDDRLVEIGMGAWGGRYYADVVEEIGPIVTADGLLQPASDGEDYHAIAARVTDWLDDTADEEGDRLILMHGISSRVLRGVLTGADPHVDFGVPILPGLPQGSVVVIENGIEGVAHLGSGHAPA